MDIVSHVSGVYAIICLVDDKLYIGSSYQARVRCLTHRNLLRKGAHHNIHLQRAWNKYGESSFVFSLIEQVAPDRLLEREQYWIDFHGCCNDMRGYNISRKAGAPMAGLQHSGQTRARMAASQLGRKHSDEVKEKIRNAHLGRKKTPEHIANMGVSRRGRKASDETRAKLRAIRSNPSLELRYKFGNATRGKNRPLEAVQKTAQAHMREYVITDPQGNEYRIKGLAAFCREHGLDQGSMSHIMRGKQSHHKGWKCRRADNGDI